MTEASHAIDSIIYRNSFSTLEMRAIFSEEKQQHNRVLVEAALANEQAQHGLIPQSAADEISKFSREGHLDLKRISEELSKTQNDVVALIRVIGENISPEAREYVHYGATSQDIHISALAMMLKEASAVMNDAVEAAISVLATLAERYKNTVMMGRTHGQHALPITFGFKVSTWLYQLLRQRTVFREFCDELTLGSMRGAVGTHLAWGANGLALERGVLSRVELKPSIISLQASEERYMEYLNWCAAMATFLARICSEVRALHRSEVAEVSEAFAVGEQVGSSTMAHKRNAEWSEAMQGLSYKVRSNALAMSSVLQEHERDGTRNAPEHLVLGETSMMLHKMLVTITEGLRTLKINSSKMLSNMEASGGLVASEALTFALASKSGQKQQSHKAVYECAMQSVESNSSFLQELRSHEFVMRWLSLQELDGVMSEVLVEVGTATMQVDQVLRAVRERTKH